MKDKIGDKFHNSIDLQDENGAVWGAVCVSTSKEFGKRDILLIDDKEGTYSARSITELINILSKKNVPFSDKKMVFDFIAEKLRNLEHDTEYYAFKSWQKNKEEKK